MRGVLEVGVAAAGDGGDVGSAQADSEGGGVVSGRDTEADWEGAGVDVLDVGAGVDLAGEGVSVPIKGTYVVADTEGTGVVVLFVGTGTDLEGEGISSTIQGRDVEAYSDGTGVVVRLSIAAAKSLSPAFVSPLRTPSVNPATATSPLGPTAIVRNTSLSDVPSCRGNRYDKYGEGLVLGMGDAAVFHQFYELLCLSHRAVTKTCVQRWIGHM